MRNSEIFITKDFVINRMRSMRGMSREVGGGPGVSRDTQSPRGEELFPESVTICLSVFLGVP